MSGQVDGTESMEKMSFLDLHDIAITQVMEKLDIRSLLAMRLVSKRMDKLHYQIKYLKKIYLQINHADYYLYVSPPNDVPQTTRSHDFEELDEKLNGLAMNTHVHIISVDVGTKNPNEQIRRIFEALLNFKADQLHVANHTSAYSLHLPQITLSSILSSNLRRVKIRRCTSISAQDSCRIRKTMLENKCKLEYFNFAPLGDYYSSLNDYFGITIERTFEQGKEESRQTWIFRAADESVELYLKFDDYVIPTLHHFEGDLHTEVSDEYVEFSKCKIDEKADASYEKVKWNHSYTWGWESI